MTVDLNCGDDGGSFVAPMQRGSRRSRKANWCVWRNMCGGGEVVKEVVYALIGEALICYPDAVHFASSLIIGSSRNSNGTLLCSV